MVDTRWLLQLYEEVGLEPNRAEVAARVTLKRLLSRKARVPEAPRPRRTIVESMARDPVASLMRIIGPGDGGLPFLDAERGTLSVTAFGDTLVEAGLDPIVAMAFAKVVVEAFAPEDFYRAIWEALGREGLVDLEALRRMDWGPLVVEEPELTAPLAEADTSHAGVSKSSAGPPAGRRPASAQRPIKKKPSR